MYKKLLSIGLATSILLAGCGSEHENKNSESSQQEEKKQSAKTKEVQAKEETIAEMTITEIKNMRNHNDYERVIKGITDLSEKTVDRVYEKKGYLAAQEEQKVGSNTVKSEMDVELDKVVRSHKIILRILSSKKAPTEELSYAERYEVRENLEVIEKIYNQNK